MNPIRLELERRLVEALKIEDIDVKLRVFTHLTDMILNRLPYDDVLAVLANEAYTQGNIDLGPYLMELSKAGSVAIEACKDRASAAITPEQRKLGEDIVGWEQHYTRKVDDNGITV